MQLSASVKLDSVSKTPDRSLPASREDAAAPRRHLTINGVRWSVRLYLARFDRRSEPDLVFECDAAVRRVRNYPANWHELPDEDLFALSHRR